MKNTYLNCEIANDDFSQEFLESIKVLSSHPIIKIHSRKNGITSGRIGECYWNSSIISQTFGGKVVFGYCISESIENSHMLYGHGCWLNPEGNLVDVTDAGKNIEWRYFLPIDQKLVLNGKCTQVLRNLYFITDLYGLKVALYASTEPHQKTFERTLHRKLKDDSPLISKEVINEKFLNTLITCDAIQEEIVESFCPSQLNEEGRKYWKYLFRPLIKEVNKESNLISEQKVGMTMDSIFREFSKIALETGKSFFEIAYERKMELLFPMWEGIDETWSNPKILGGVVTGISTSTGKSISDYSLHPDVLRNYPIPKDPQLKNELKNRVNKLNRRSREHISYKEFLVLSDPYLYPHPSLVKKITSTPLERSPLKRIAV